ncbi:MAG: DsbA family protein [Clostridiales bacterium]|nr:DsbA family protein [Clostridiales bacterium]
MKIEIWSDIACPFCYIGKQRLEIALERFEHKEDVKISFRSFQLDPYAKKNTGMDIRKRYIKKCIDLSGFFTSRKIK